MIRIDTEYPGFSTRFIEVADATKQRVVQYIVNSALKASGVNDRTILKALENLQHMERYPMEMIHEIEGLRDEYDETYFEMNETDPDTAIDYFKKARAVTALVFALGSKTDNGRLECIYEALHAIGEKEKVLVELNSLLK